MTGFGRAEIQETDRHITAELKSVNHKYLDISVKMPRRFNAFEARIRNFLKEYATRGKIDIFISFDDRSEGSKSLAYNSALAAEYVACYRQIRDNFGLADDISTSVIARCPDVLNAEEQNGDEEKLWEMLENVLREAFSAFRESREKEGEALKENILLKLSEMDSHLDIIEERLPELTAAYKAKLTERVGEFLEADQIDEGRIAAEVVIYADKIAIDEELVRLRTHINHMRDVLQEGNDMGRNLDFIAQEMNRESNTILSKTSDIEITNIGIELKTCIEKIREQVQNIE